MIDLTLLEDFIVGAGESLEEMETALLSLEVEPNSKELLDTIFRDIHTIKGAAQFVGLESVSALSHVAEDLLDSLRQGEKSASLDIITVFIQTKDRIELLVADLERNQTEETEVDDLINQLNFYLNNQSTLINNEILAEPVTEENTDEALTFFLEEDKEDKQEEDLSFLVESDSETEDLSSFLANDDTDSIAGEDLSFLVEDDTDSTASEDLSFLVEDDTDLTASEDLSFLVGDDTDSTVNEDLSFLVEDDVDLTANEDLSFLAESETDEILFPEKNNIADDLTASNQVFGGIDDNFILPDEEYDQELFGIFIEQLKEKLALLDEFIVNALTADNNEDLLADSIDIVESLRFSANYMGYEQLTSFYFNWIEVIVNVQNEELTTEPRSFDFMGEYLQKLRHIFPQLQQLDLEPNNDNKIIETAIDNLKVDEGHLAFIEGLIEEEQKLEEPEPIEKTVIDEKPDNLEKLEINSFAEEDEQLFSQLTAALEASIEDTIVNDPINEVFEALLSSTENEFIEETEPLKSLEVKTLDEVNQEEQQALKSLVAPPKQQEEASAPPLKKSVKSNQQAAPEKIFKKSIRIDADKIDSLMNQVGELIVNRASFFQLANEIIGLQQNLKEAGLGQKELKSVRAFAYRFSEAIISLGRTSNELQEGVMTVRMLPIAQLFNRYPRLVHDLAHSHHKKVQLEIRGEDTELDKMIIEELSDPIIHMIRNAIGHGLELPEKRKELGKPETGTLTLEAYHESNHIVIEVIDDGKGIDADKIRKKALAKGLFSEEELARMSSKELTRFIMMPGFSTAEKIDSTSGRGVGMDVVKKNIEKLNGTIEIESITGVETKIRLKIPLTLAIIPALLVRVSTNFFTVPLANVEETLRVNQSNISIMEDTEVMYLRGKTVPIFRLSALFSIQSDLSSDSTDYFVVIVNTGAEQVGFMVDELLGQEEVVIKPLADYLQENSGFSGATIIGGGRISLILDVNELSNIAKTAQIEKHHVQESQSLASLDVVDEFS